MHPIQDVHDKVKSDLRLFGWMGGRRYRGIEGQYETSSHMFKQALELLEGDQLLDTSKGEHLRSVVTQIGREVLQETGTWLALKGDRAVHPI